MILSIITQPWPYTLAIIAFLVFVMIIRDAVKRNSNYKPDSENESQQQSNMNATEKESETTNVENATATEKQVESTEENATTDTALDFVKEETTQENISESDKENAETVVLEEGDKAEGVVEETVEETKEIPDNQKVPQAGESLGRIHDSN